MYKVLIVDDESIIVEGLTRVIPWEKYGCEVVATAYDAAQGAQAIRAHKPDILFTDIRMPDGDGLSMLAGLRTEYPAMQVTVLTGFRDFNYAQQAIRLGVARFLLKPSKMEELEEALEVMTARLRQAGALPAGEKEAAEAEEKKEAPTDAAGSFVVRQAIAYIEEHCTEKISLQDVADTCYVSQWHLSKLLGKHSGKSFYDLLNLARVAKAKTLMADPALRIGDISDLLGYSDTSHFSRVFKKLEGVSANEYRNEHLG